MVRRFLLIPIVILIFFTGIGFAQDSASSVQIDVKEFSLKNGMQFLIVERHTAPQVACRLAILAGSSLEDTGKTGIAHLLEHMLFKGTKNFGTLDPEKDETIQSKIEAAYKAILKEQKKRDNYQQCDKSVSCNKKGYYSAIITGYHDFVRLVASRMTVLCPA